MASVFSALGLEPETIVHDQLGRPMPIADLRPIRERFALFAAKSARAWRGVIANHGSKKEALNRVGRNLRGLCGLGANSLPRLLLCQIIGTCQAAGSRISLCLLGACGAGHSLLCDEW